MKKDNPQTRLKQLYNKSRKIHIPQNEKLVFFSDMHMGNGKKRDDFTNNSDIVTKVLGKYYLEKDYNLFLNGDIEELWKFPMNKIREAWPELYSVFDKFDEKKRLYKLIGNHDHNLLWDPVNQVPYELYEGIKLTYGDYPFFIYHGHQSSYAYSHLASIIEFFIAFFSRPLNIKNYSVAYDSEKKVSVEKQAYTFAKEMRIISIIGHSHRPLFESLSGRDNLLFKVETALRKYRDAEKEEQEKIKKEIKELGEELKLIEESDPYMPVSSLYSSGFVQPCLFNSGCTIGKRGISCIEIKNGKISLVHWFDYRRKSKMDESTKAKAKKLNSTPYRKIVLKEDDLSYIFDSTHLLS